MKKLLFLLLLIPFIGTASIESCHVQNGSVVIRSSVNGRNTIWVGSDGKLAGWSSEIVVIQNGPRLKVYGEDGRHKGGFTLRSGETISNVMKDYIVVVNQFGNTIKYNAYGNRV